MDVKYKKTTSPNPANTSYEVQENGTVIGTIHKVGAGKWMIGQGAGSEEIIIFATRKAATEHLQQISPTATGCCQQDPCVEPPCPGGVVNREKRTLRGVLSGFFSRS